MQHQRWVYVLLVVVSVALGAVIGGLPNQRQDTPLRAVQTSSTTAVPLDTTAGANPAAQPAATSTTTTARVP